MPRPIRHNEAGCDYHVYNRGPNGRLVYVDDRDRRWFARGLGRTASDYEVQILAFCFMGNHYHLILRCLEASLDVFMRDLTSRYVRYFNDRHGVEGRLCRDRYRSKHVATREYAKTLGAYVHRNPKDLGYEHRLAEYPWSSLAYYLSPEEAPWWLDPEPLLDACGGVDAHTRLVNRPLGLDLVADASPEEIYVAWAVRQVDEIFALAGLDRCAIVEGNGTDPDRSALLVFVRESVDLPYSALAEILGFSSTSSLHRAVRRARAAVAAEPSALHHFRALRAAAADYDER